MEINSYQSVFREKLLEHLLLGELLKISWKTGKADMEISFPAIDRGGHDVLIEANGVSRHIQLKASALTGKTVVQKVHHGLSQKPSGCVVWVLFDPDTLAIGPFLFFGGTPGSSLPSLDGLRVGKHTKGNKDGIKTIRPNIREIPKRLFEKILTLEALYGALFGSEFGGGVSGAINSESEGP
jgi:hypothetical protein